MEEEKKEEIVVEKLTLKDRVKKIKPKDLIVPSVLCVLFLGAAIGIINYQQKARKNSAPEIEITKPTDAQSVTDAQVVLEGKTQVGNKVTVNGNEVTVDKKGQFASEVPLNEGNNQIKVTAESAGGKKNEKDISVTRTGAAATTTAQPTENASPAAPEAVATTIPTNLNSSGPESFWLPEALSLSGVGAAWILSKKKLKKVLKG